MPFGRKGPFLSLVYIYLVYMLDTRMHALVGLKTLVIFALPGLCIDGRWTVSFDSSVTMPACYDGVRGGPEWRPARGHVEPASSQNQNKPI